MTSGFLPGCNFYAQTREPLPIRTLAPGCLNPAAHCTKQSPASGIEVGIVQIVPIHSLTNRLSPQMLGRFGDPKKAGSSRTQSRWRRLEYATASGTLDKRLANHARLRLAFRRIAAYLRLEYAGNGNACARKLIDLRPPIFQRGVIAIAAANNRRPRARQISAIEMVNGFQGSFSLKIGSANQFRGGLLNFTKQVSAAAPFVPRKVRSCGSWFSLKETNT